MDIRIDIPEYVGAVTDRIEENGFEAFVVGGCVRDVFLGKVPNDWDITTSAYPNFIEKLFSAKPFKAIPTGIAHGTVTVVYENKPTEVTTYRVDGEYNDNRHPDFVSFTSSIEQDLARRDLTVNAMAYSPKRGLVDPFGGRSDLENRVIRCVGEPQKRFSEDALRILRTLRFASTLGFQIEENTAKAAYSLSNNLESISRERVYSELSKLVCGENSAEIIKLYYPILERVIPVSDSSDVYEKLNLTGCCNNLPLKYAALLYDFDAENVLRALKADKKTVMRVKSILSDKCADDVTKAKLLCSRVGTDIAREIQILAFARGEIPFECIGYIDEIEQTGECVSIKQLKINGNDLLITGFEPARIGLVLSGLLRCVIMGNIPNERSALIEAARKYL